MSCAATRAGRSDSTCRGGAVLALALSIVGLVARDAAASWKQSAFVIGGYEASDDPISLIRLDEAGLGVVVPLASTPRTARQIVARLDSLRASRPRFQLQALVSDFTPRAGALFKNPDPVANRSAILRELVPAAGLNSPSVAGWFLWDEPPGRDRAIRSIRDLTRLIRDSTNGAGTHDKLPLVNLYPVQAYGAFETPCSPDTVVAYGCYLDRFLSPFAADSLPAPVISFDKYPFEGPGADFRLYYVQLAIVRDKAALYSRPNYSIPFWSVIQAAPRRENANAPYHPTPTFNQIRWQAYVSVAYGAKGIFYWTLRPRDDAPSRPGYGASFLTRDGSPNGALYDSLTALNRELLGLGPTLMSLEPVAVFHAAANRFVIPQRDDSLARARAHLVTGLRGSTPQGMAGDFKARGSRDHYLLVVNKDTVLAQAFRVALRRAAVTVHRVGKSRGELIPVASNSSSFTTGTISPGSGELFKLVLSAPR